MQILHITIFDFYFAFNNQSPLVMESKKKNLLSTCKVWLVGIDLVSWVLVNSCLKVKSDSDLLCLNKPSWDRFIKMPEMFLRDYGPY